MAKRIAPRLTRPDRAWLQRAREARDAHGVRLIDVYLADMNGVVPAAV
ncbi:MAG: hypothetical protein IPJ61_08570 [Tessaracoccus sp.]|nr:hypothetical protein [Tessaracoccus sp.]MBK7821115.1 hypothetical protein [Tessaracoccus sp.]